MLATRSPKGHRSGQPELSDQGLHDRWLADATAAGLGPESWLPDVLDRPGFHHEVALDTAVSESLTELATASSTWGRRHVVREMGPTGACRRGQRRGDPALGGTGHRCGPGPSRRGGPGGALS